MDYEPVAARIAGLYRQADQELHARQQRLDTALHTHHGTGLLHGSGVRTGRTGHHTESYGLLARHAVAGLETAELLAATERRLDTPLWKGNEPTDGRCRVDGQQEPRTGHLLRRHALCTHMAGIPLRRAAYHEQCGAVCGREGEHTYQQVVHAGTDSGTARRHDDDKRVGLWYGEQSLTTRERPLHPVAAQARPVGDGHDGTRRMGKEREAALVPSAIPHAFVQRLAGFQLAQHE